MTALVLSLTAAALVLAVLAWVPKSGSTLEIVLSAVMLAWSAISARSESRYDGAESNSARATSRWSG